MGYQTDSDKLTFQKGAFSPQWRFLIHSILHCLSPKKTAWEQFSSNIATTVICLATNRKFNFSRYAEEQLQQTQDQYHVTLLANKVFYKLEEATKGYSGRKVALFPTMLDVMKLPLLLQESLFIHLHPHYDEDVATVILPKQDQEAREKGSSCLTLVLAGLQQNGLSQGKKSKKELEQESLSFAKAIGLQEQMDEEQRAQTSRDEEIARQWDEEERQRAMSEIKTSKKIDWNDPLVIRYGYIKNHKKTVKNGQTRIQERKSVQELKAKSKAKGFSKLKGGKDNSMALVQDGMDKIVISRLLLVDQARKCHEDVRKHMKMIGFTLESLTQQAQMSLSRIATLSIRVSSFVIQGLKFILQ
ncbi:hypothetical protein Tco_1294016 [Tanacetum coccineum]